MFLYRYRRQLLLIVPLLALISYQLSYYPTVTIDNVWDMGIELANMLVCFVLFLKIEDIKKARAIYFALLISVYTLMVGSTLDVLDELVEVPERMELLEDLFQSLGFIFFILSCFKWVDFHRAQTRMMQNLAEVDSLTGLSNRRAFLNMSKNYFRLNEDEQVSILVIDIDFFKTVNDTYGHQFGDKLLIKIANEIKLCLRKGDYVARIGGEEFVVLLKNASISQAGDIAENIRMKVEEMPIYFENQKVDSSVSIGYTSSAEEVKEFETLFSKADKALYTAKSEGRNCSRYFV